MDKKLLNYAALSAFKSYFYKDLLTLSHLKGGMQSIDYFVDRNGDKQEVNFWGWELQKGTERYLLPARMNSAEGGKEVKLHEILPIFAETKTEVAYRGQVYNLIIKPKSMRFRPKKHYTFKQLIDNLSSFNHTNKEHYKLLWLLGYTSMTDRVYYRICSPPSFGKSSVVDTLGHLIGSATKIVKPTLAKLEHRTSYKWLVLDEAVDIPGADWKLIDQFLLDVAAFSPTVEKHSRAIGQGSETYDVTQHAISLAYNDITDYPDKVEYFDQVAKKALKDRFPALRVHGGFTEDFSIVKELDIQSFAKQNEEEYRKLIETFTYFKENKRSELNYYSNETSFDDLPERWKININKILTTIDLYCETQEEYNHWTEVLRKAIDDYKDMLRYPQVWDKTKKKLSLATQETLQAELKNIPTFTQKLEHLQTAGTVSHSKEVKGW